MALHAAVTDDAIIELYWQRNKQAIAETDFKYGRYLSAVIRNIVLDRLDCEECLNDTYLGAWNAMPPSRPQVLKAFLTTIARRTAVKRYHRNRRQSVIPSELTVSLSELEDCIADSGGVGADFDAERLGRLLSAFVRALPERQQFIFIGRYYAAEPIDTIAKDLRVSRSTVNKELASIRNRLKETLEGEGYTL